MITELIKQYLDFEKTLMESSLKFDVQVNNNLYDIKWINLKPKIVCNLVIPSEFNMLEQGTEEQAIEVLNNLLFIVKMHQVPNSLFVKPEFRIK